MTWSVSRIYASWGQGVWDGLWGLTNSVVWCGMVWQCTVGCGMVVHCLIGYGMVLQCMVGYDMVL